MTRAPGHGIETLRLAAGPLELEFLPGLGGRLWSLRIDGVDLLWRDRSAWARPEGAWINAGGSKAWPAPQSAWGGPPGPIDASPFAARVDRRAGGRRITLSAEPDAATGLQVTRRFDVPSSGRPGFTQRTEFRNVGDVPRTWAVWEVCQVPATEGDAVTVDTSGAPVALGGDLPGERVGGRWRVPLRGGSGKVGFPDATGRARFRRADGSGFDWRFDAEPGRPHADADSPVTVYARAAHGVEPAMAYGEVEAMTALRTLAPGDRIVQRIAWRVTPPCGGRGGRPAAGAAARPITGARAGAPTRA